MKNIMIATGVIVFSVVFLCLTTGCGKRESVPEGANPSVYTTNNPSLPVGQEAVFKPLVYKDFATGCYYLGNTSNSSALTPRMNREGKHICD